MSVGEVFGPGFTGLTEEQKIRRAATELEAVVLTQLLGAMRNTVPEGGLLERSASNEIFRSLFDTELARVAAKKSPFGLADAIVKELGESAKPVKGPPTEAEGAERGPVAPSRFRRIG